MLCSLIDRMALEQELTHCHWSLLSSLTCSYRDQELFNTVKKSNPQEVLTMLLVLVQVAKIGDFGVRSRLLQDCLLGLQRQRAVGS